MNTAELIQAVKDAGCEFECIINGDLYSFLRGCESIWISLPTVFPWTRDNEPDSDIFASLVAHVQKKHIIYSSTTSDCWHIRATYGKLEVIYDFDKKSGDRIPVSIEMDEGVDPQHELERVNNPAALTRWLRSLVDEARAMTKKIRAAQIQVVGKEFQNYE